MDNCADPEMNRTEVQWAFRNIHTPMGVATYSNVRIEELKDFLPSTAYNIFQKTFDTHVDIL